jgi:hypothetical protein
VWSQRDSTRKPAVRTEHHGHAGAGAAGAAAAAGHRRRGRLRRRGAVWLRPPVSGASVSRESGVRDGASSSALCGRPRPEAKVEQDAQEAAERYVPTRPPCCCKLGPPPTRAEALATAAARSRSRSQAPLLRLLVPCVCADVRSGPTGTQSDPEGSEASGVPAVRGAEAAAHLPMLVPPITHLLRASRLANVGICKRN